MPDLPGDSRRYLMSNDIVLQVAKGKDSEIESRRFVRVFVHLINPPMQELVWYVQVLSVPMLSDPSTTGLQEISGGRPIHRLRMPRVHAGGQFFILWENNSIRE
jgi:hypothetical protein